jgi:hypothetical protein
MNVNSLKRALIIFAFVAPMIFMLFAVQRGRSLMKQKDVIFSQVVVNTLTNWGKTHTTEPLRSVDLDSVLTNITLVTPLTSVQKSKLIEAVKGFYKCYSQTSFEGFKEYRLQLPYEVDTNKLELLLKVFAHGYQRTGDSEKDIEAVWHYYASSNIISQVDPSSIKITVELLDSRDKGIFKKAYGQITNANVGVLFFPQIIINHPTAHEIYERSHEKQILHATVEQYVETTGDKFTTGPTPNPLYVSFYWDDDHGQWRPYQMAKLLGWYKTTF